MPLMPSRPRRTTFARRCCALAGTASVALGVLLMPWVAGRAAADASTAPAASAALSPSSTAAGPSASATPTPSSSASASPTPSPSASASPKPSHTTSKPKPKRSHPVRPPTAPPGGVVVRGPRMWDPAENRDFPARSYIAVSQVGSITNQVVEVSWSGFTPSSNVDYNPSGTDYPVMVAECQGTHPTRWSQCFGASNGGVQGAFSSYGPMNTAYATTDPRGTGSTPIQLLTAEENSFLGCNIHSPCSIVVVPSQGGNILDTPVNCNDHSMDTNLSDLGSYAFNSSYGTCSWRDRIIIPLHFAQTPTDCPVLNPNFSVIGSPMLARAMNSWQAALCSISDPVSIQYDASQSEPLAREDFQTGLDDVALTTLPGTGTSKHPYTYAPVAISSVAIAFWIDNPNTGLPLNHLKLDPRLVAKLLTQSYDFDGEACSGGAVKRGISCDNAIDNDPRSLFTDPEFEQLNKHVATVGDGYQVPTVMSGESDMTWEVTRWIAANKAGKSFVDGTFDPWGEHVNTDYLNMQLPTNSFNSMDPFAPIAHRYSPVFPLSAVAQYQVDNWYPATDWQPDPQGNYDKLSPEVPGDRALFAILDEADAAAYELPVASIENAAGRYISPTDASMTDALATMTTASNHITQDVRENDKKAKGAYPLTMVIYAMVPTQGVGKKKAAKIAQWLDYVADDGQQPGNNSGQLPPGYLPLTASMRAQTLKAAAQVLAQKGNKKPAATPSASASATPAAIATPKPSATSGGSVSLGFDTHPGISGLTRYAIPILLIAGGLLAVAASFSFVIGRGGSAAFAGLRKVRVPLVKLRRKKP
jgi:hypothetical protein